MSEDSTTASEILTGALEVPAKNGKFMVYDGKEYIEIPGGLPGFYKRFLELQERVEKLETFVPDHVHRITYPRTPYRLPEQEGRW